MWDKPGFARLSRILRPLMAVMVLLFALQQPALAMSPGGGGSGGAYDNVESKCDQHKGFVNHVVNCIKDTVNDTIQQFFDGFFPQVAYIVNIAVLFAVTIYGCLLAMPGGLEKPARDTMVLLLRIGLVTYFFNQGPLLWDWSRGTLEDLTNVVFQVGSSQQMKCGTGGANLWERLDCIIDVLIGIKGSSDTELKAVASGGNFNGMVRGLSGFFFQSMMSGGMGFFIGLIGFYMTWTILMATFKSIQTFIAAYIGIAFLLVFTPIFVPMAMLSATREYFQRWYQIVLGFIGQPVILFAYLSIALVALDIMFISGNNSFLKVLTCQDPNQGTNVNEQIANKGGYGTNDFTGSEHIKKTTQMTQTSQKDMGAFGAKFPSLSTAQSGDELKKDPFNARMTFPMQAVKWDKMCSSGGGGGGGGDQGKKKQQEVLSYAITLALAAFCFISMLHYVPVMATDLTGGIHAVPNLYASVGGTLPGQEGMEKFAGKVMGGATDKIKDAFSGMITRR